MKKSGNGFWLLDSSGRGWFPALSEIVSLSSTYRHETCPKPKKPISSTSYTPSAQNTESSGTNEHGDD